LLRHPLTICHPPSLQVFAYIYQNLEPFACVAAAALFVTILAARVGGAEGPGGECGDWAVAVERDAASACALLLVCNALNVVKTVKTVGLLIISLYRIATHDILKFLAVYAVFFAGFLGALQTHYDAADNFLAAAAGGHLGGVAEGVPGDLAGCERLRRTVRETCYVLFQLSIDTSFLVSQVANR
jgi:hypothetical protein